MSLGVYHKKYYIFLIIFLVTVPFLSACNKILSSDSGRALDLMETLISEPENQNKLSEITLNQNWSTANVLPQIQGMNALRYLRARVKQEQSLDYSASRKTILNDGRSYVEVTVAELLPGVLHKKKSRFIFRVFFKEDTSGNTVIISCENLN